MLFEPKKLYRIVYKYSSTYSIIIEANNAAQALKKFSKKIHKKVYIPSALSIVSIEEYKVSH